MEHLPCTGIRGERYLEGWRWAKTFFERRDDSITREVQVKALFGVTSVCLAATNNLEYVIEGLSQCAILASEISGYNYLACSLASLAEQELERSQYVEGQKRVQLRRSGLEHAQEAIRVLKKVDAKWFRAFTCNIVYSPLNALRGDLQASHLQYTITLCKQVGDIGLSAETNNSLGFWHLNSKRYDEAIRIFAEAQELFQEMGNEYQVAWNSVYIAKAQHEKGALRETKRYCLAAIRQFLGIGQKRIHLVAGLADIAESAGDTKRFAQLVGAVKGLKCELARMDENWLDKAEERIMRDPLLRAEWEKSKVMSLDEAIAYALEDEE